MKFLLLLVGIASGLAAPLGLPSFEISGYSRSNVPEMLVTFGNGETHEMVLQPYSKSSCNFIGQLKNVPSSVGVTGCLNNPGDKMHITLLAPFDMKSITYELDYNGQVTAEENPFKYQKEPSGILPTKNRYSKCGNGDEWQLNKDNMGDEEEDLDIELQADAAASSMVTWPSELFVYVKFGYDRTLKAQLEKDGTNFNSWVDSVMTHVQAYYKHESLPTQILFKYDTSETIFKDKDIPSCESGGLRTWREYGLEDADPKVDLYCAFGRDQNYWGTAGQAYVGGACKDASKTSFNEWRKTATENGRVVAHEMGHNFGMSHDFDKKHGGDGTKDGPGLCNGKGHMSYDDAPAKWSSCSVSDFTEHYVSRNWGNTCMKSWDAYCGDACPGPDCSMNPDNICENPARFGGCNGIYKSYFDMACKKTCGIC